MDKLFSPNEQNFENDFKQIVLRIRLKIFMTTAMIPDYGFVYTIIYYRDFCIEYRLLRSKSPQKWFLYIWDRYKIE